MQLKNQRIIPLKQLLIFGSFMLFSIFLTGQNTLEDREKRLVEQYRTFVAAPYDLRYDSLAQPFEDSLMALLRIPASWSHDFSLLEKERFGVNVAPDSTFRAFCWDELSGGTWHNFISLIQYPRGDSLFVGRFNTIGRETFKDVFLNKFHLLPNRHYLALGWGTHGAGHHHIILVVMKWQDGVLIETSAFSEDTTIFVVVAARSAKFEFSFDPTNFSFQVNEFLRDEEMGFYLPTGKKRTFQWFDGKYLEKD